MLRFRNVFYTISKLFHCPAKVFSEQIVHKFAILCCESYTCILILLCLSIFRSGAISGLGWVWMDGLGSLCGAIVWASLCDANKGGQFRLVNFASHFIRVQIFQIDFPLIISASKYFRQISLSFYICRGQNEQPAIPQIYLLGDEMNSCLKEGMESESEIINQIFGHHAASKKER